MSFPLRLPFSVQAFLVSPDDAGWSVLLLQRVARPDLALPDFWQGVSGALEAGESFETAALREIREETGLAPVRLEPTGYEHGYPVKPEWRHAYGPRATAIQEKVFLGLLTSPQSPALSAEHQGFRWCREREALKLLTFGRNGSCVRSVFSALRCPGRRAPS